MRSLQRTALVIGFFAISLVTAQPKADAADAATIGSVRNVVAPASVVREGREIPAQTGLKLHAGDVLQTGDGGQLGVILRDDSLLSLGPRSRVAIERFVFAPAERQFGFVTRVYRGTAAFVSGLIGRLAPESATVETPVATIGIRGTRFAVRVAE